jgi:hypothetical protein
LCQWNGRNSLIAVCSLPWFYAGIHPADLVSPGRPATQGGEIYRRQAPFQKDFSFDELNRNGDGCLVIDYSLGTREFALHVIANAEKPQKNSIIGPPEWK